MRKSVGDLACPYPDKISGKQPDLRLTTRCEPWILQATKRRDRSEGIRRRKVRWERKVRKRKD